MIWIALAWLTGACVVGWSYGRLGGDHGDDWAPIVVLGWPLVIPAMAAMVILVSPIMLVTWLVEQGQNARCRAISKPASPMPWSGET